MSDAVSRAAEPLRLLAELHRQVDRDVETLARRHADRLQCRPGCSGCCVDGITVFEVEAERIRERHAGLLAVGRPSPEGACAFLDDRGTCRIYPSRPYVCRTQGLPLRWLSDDEAADRVELRDICPLNEIDTEPIEALPASDCFSLGPYEGRLARLQVSRSGAPPRRIALRDLFVPGDGR